MTPSIDSAPPLGAGSIILAAGSIGTVSFDERVSAAAAAGFDGIGLSSWEYGLLKADGYTAPRMREQLNRHGLRLAELECVIGFAAPGVAGPIPGLIYTDRREEAELFEMAEEFGARHLMAVGTLYSEVLEHDAIEAFAGLCDRAAAHGLLVALEFVPCITNVPDAGIAQRIVEQAGRANGGICVDSWHHFRGRADDDLLRAIPPEKVFLIQLSDGPKSPSDPDFMTEQANRMPPGHGDFGLAHLLQLLWQMGVAAPISVEVLSTDFGTRPTAELVKILGDATGAVISQARQSGP